MARVASIAAPVSVRRPARSVDDGRTGQRLHGHHDSIDPARSVRTAR
jgi:hypothetical protein